MVHARTGTLVSLNAGGGVVIVTDRSILTAGVSVPRGGLTERIVSKAEGPSLPGCFCAFQGIPQPHVIAYLLTKTKFKKAREGILSGAAWEEAITPRNTIALAAVNRVRRDYGDSTITVG